MFAIRRWHQVGRDPRRGVIIARYDPPYGHTPADLRYVHRMRYDTRCFSSEILALDVAGRLSVHKDEDFFGETWWLERRDPRPEALLPTVPQRVVLEGLFVDKTNRVELQGSDAREVWWAIQGHSKVLEQQLHPRYFTRHLGSVAAAGVLAAATIGLAFLVSGGSGTPAILAVSAMMLVAVVTFGSLVRAPTLRGRELLDEIEGLKLYLTVAERDELERLPGPSGPPLLDAKRYE